MNLNNDSSTAKEEQPLIPPSPSTGRGLGGLTGVGFLQLGGVRVVKISNRGRRKRTPAMKTNGNVVKQVSNEGK